MDKNRIYRIFNILFFVGIIISAVFYLHYNIYLLDDFRQTFFISKSIKTLILSADHGRYISWIAMKTVTHGFSKFMHIHPNDNIYFAQAIKGLNFAILFYLISKLFYLKKEDKTVNPLIYSFVIVISLYFITFDYFRVVNFANQHFAYILNFIFFFPALFILSKYYLDKKIPENKDLLKISFWAFLLGISAHFNIVTFTGILFIVACHLLIENRKNLKQIIKEKFNYKIFIPIIFFATGALCSILSQHFQQLLMNDRHVQGSTLSYIVNNFWDFSKEWFYNVFFITPNNILIVSIILITVYLIIKMYRNKIFEDLRQIILALSVVFGAMFFNFSLIVCGRTFYDGKSYWLVHDDLRLMTCFYFLVALIILLSVLYEHIKLKKRFWIILSSISLFLLYWIYPYYEINYYDSIINRRLMYEVDKATAYYTLNNYDYILLPKNPILQQWIIEQKQYNYYFRKSFGYEMKDNVTLYQAPNIRFFDVTKKDGLKFTKEELKELKFTKLLDKDFILYGDKH